LDLKVNRLIRLSFGPFQLGQLEPGRVEEVPRRVLRQQLGKNWQAIVDGSIPKGADDESDEPQAGKSGGAKFAAKGRTNSGADKKPQSGKKRGDKPRSDKSKGPSKNARHKR
jgi:23S rRNA pseudouridine2605 synthase